VGLVTSGGKYINNDSNIITISKISNWSCKPDFKLFFRGTLLKVCGQKITRVRYINVCGLAEFVMKSLFFNKLGFRM
jgi:hypothetical protein